MKRKTRNKDPVCLEEPWKRARSVLLECIEGEEYLFFSFFSGGGGRAQQLGDCNGPWICVDPPAEDQWISASVRADDQLGTWLGKEQGISVVLTKFVWCGLSE
jgi:hypothetical protein